MSPPVNSRLFGSIWFIIILTNETKFLQDFSVSTRSGKKTLLKRKLLHFFQTFRGSILSSYEFPKPGGVSIENVTWLGRHFVNSECSVGEDQLEVGCVLPGPISDLVAEPGVLGRHQAYGPLQTIVRYLK